MSYRKNSSPYFTVARFNSVCPATGRAIVKGETICMWSGKAYADDSKQADECRALQFASDYGMADSNY